MEAQTLDDYDLWLEASLMRILRAGGVKISSQVPLLLALKEWEEAPPGTNRHHVLHSLLKAWGPQVAAYQRKQLQDRGLEANEESVLRAL